MFTENLKIQILNKWSNIRTHAFVNTWVLIIQRKSARETVKKTDKVSKKGGVSIELNFFMWCI